MAEAKKVVHVKHVAFFEEGTDLRAINGSAVAVLCGEKIPYIPYKVDPTLGQNTVGDHSPWSEEGMCASCLGKWQGGNFDHQISWMIVGVLEEVPTHSHKYRGIAENLGSFHDRASYWTKYACTHCNVIFIVGARNMAFQ